MILKRKAKALDHEKNIRNIPSSRWEIVACLIPREYNSRIPISQLHQQHTKKENQTPGGWPTAITNILPLAWNRIKQGCRFLQWNNMSLNPLFKNDNSSASSNLTLLNLHTNAKDLLTNLSGYLD